MNTIDFDLAELKTQIDFMHMLTISTEIVSKLRVVNNTIPFSSGETVQVLNQINIELFNIAKEMKELFISTETWLKNTYKAVKENDENLIKMYEK